MAEQRLVVVGAGMAAHRLLEELLARAPRRYAITLIGAEPHAPYNRILLSQVLAGERRREDAWLGDTAALAARGVRFRRAAEVSAVDRDLRVVVTAAGEVIGYDKLVLATGSRPIRLAIPGADLAGVATFRTLDDVEALIAAAEPDTPAVVIGGGLLGLEAAAGLARRGMRTSIVHLMPTLMERQIDAAASGLLLRSLAARGITVHAPAATAAFVGAERVEGVRLKGGTVLPARLVVVAIGIRPNADLARAAGLACRNGILVGDDLATSDPAIFALGECAEHRGQTFGLVAPIHEQAAVLGRRLAGEDCAYSGSLAYTSLKVTGVDLFSAGAFEAAAGQEAIVLRDAAAGVYRKLVVGDGRLVGALLFGDVDEAQWYLELIGSGTPIGAMRGELMFGRRYARDLAA
jgi:nitrite reductase (NADH) large subunit